jgi:hypothetical protein
MDVLTHKRISPMIIWSGWGIMVGLVAFAIVMLTQLCVNAVMQDDHFYQTNGWPKLLGLWIAAAVSWPMGHVMNRGEERWIYDPETSEPVLVREGGNEHTLFFIPVQYWWIVLAVLGVVFAFV